MIDPRRIILPDNPSEWPDIPEHIWEKLKPKNGIYLPWQKRAMDKIARSRWFLIRNNHRERCGNCRQGAIPGAIHDYLTLGCVELPFHGIEDLVLVMQEWNEERRERLISGMTPGTIVPITPSDAFKYIGRIKDKGYNLYPNLMI